MDNMHRKPKLVFFQYKYDERLPEFLLIHKREHVKCLSQFFDLTVIHEDCDYLQICDKYRPDLALFESGVNHETCRRLKIENIHACPEIPKIALHNADGFCNARAGFLSDMDHWGIETFFAISITAAEHTSEIADNLFVWPVFADAEIYHDYGCWKSIPVLFTGNRSQFYPWRRNIFKLVSERYPSLICQHPGYGPGAGKVHVMVGENYARTINASWFVPACGTVSKEVVRKHFEIPACNACLIAERSPGLEAAGFIDMINCVFADEHDVLDKLDYLFQNPDEVNRITSAGYQLVRSRHTMAHRDQILQWFNLHKSLKSDERIVQGGPFEPLLVIQKESGIKTSHIISNGFHLQLLRQGDELLWKGKYEDAERSYLQCINYMRWMPEPKLRLALCNLYKGNAKMAISILAEPIQFILVQYKAMDPDPVEWAYFVISFLCLGKSDDALQRAGQFPWLRHPELDRARWAAHVIKTERIAPPPIKEDTQKSRRSMHQLPSRNSKEWIVQLCIMMKACGQGDMAETLTKCLSLEAEPVQVKQGDAPDNREISVGPEGDLDKKWVRKDAVSFFKKRLLYSNLGVTLKHCIADALHRLEQKFGYFLPYHLSTMRDDEFFKAIQDLTRDETIKNALVIGAVDGKGSTEAFMAGILENQNRPSVFCISGSRRRFKILNRSLANNPIVKWYELSINLTEELESTVKRIKEDHHITSFDAVLIDSSIIKNQSTVSGGLNEELLGARIVLLDDINNFYNFDKHSRLLRNPIYVLVACNPGLRNGYAIFKKDSPL
jgi:Glycosyl transferases group 1